MKKLLSVVACVCALMVLVGSVRAADTFVATGGGSYPAEILAEQAYVVSTEYSFAATNAGVSNVVQMVSVPAGTLVLAVLAEISTIEDSASNLTVGDGTDPDGWLAATDMTSLLTAAAGAGAYADGKYYPAADTVDAVVSAACDKAVIRVWVVMVPVTW